MPAACVSPSWQAQGSTLIPTLVGDDSRVIAWHAGRLIMQGEFLDDVAKVLAKLPASDSMINLCEDRYNFLVTYLAGVIAGHRVLLPPTRVEQVVKEIESLHEGSYRIDDAVMTQGSDEHAEIALETKADQLAMIGYTSGSTGQPSAQAKRWRALHASAAHNSAAMRRAMNLRECDNAFIVATVPPQHMYGMELSVLLPLLGGMAVHSGRPLFPADIASALAQVPEPRVLVSTPVHLRAIAQSTQAFPPTSLIVSATAPLDKALASAVEAKLKAPLLEMFGSTETCVIATRRTAMDDYWHAYEAVTLEPQVDGTRVDAPWFQQAVTLQDLLELGPDDRFAVRGRNADMIEVAGKRASLADLTRRLLAIEGVKDAAVFQPDQDEVGTIYRVAAAVVAPGMNAKQILKHLASTVDAAFLPRPLMLVDALPRNDVGKLPRGKLLELLASRSGS
jgi:acyl-coenzyme A synthetase/AMP-(fatty) acid ligase